MRSIRLPSGRPERGALLVAIAVVALGAGGVLALAPTLIDAPAPGAASAVAEGTHGPSASAPEATAGPAGEAAPSQAPRTSPGPGEPPAASTWTLPPGWRHDLQCYDQEGNDLPECLLHLYDAAGTEQDGWPVAIPGTCDYDLAGGPRDEVFVACSRDGRAVVTGLDRSGASLPGWPVSLRGAVALSFWHDLAGGSGTSSVGVGPDETVYVAVRTGGDSGRYAIHALGPDGSPRAGWPQVLPGAAQGFQVAPNGTVVAWWYEGVEEGIGLSARRTVFTAIGPDGRTKQGWPKGSKGAASGPVVWSDGSIYYTSATGKVYGHDRAGTVIDGWPFRLGSPVAPQLRPDGTLLFVGESEVVALDRQGGVVPGWPYRTGGSFVAPMCDTPGWPSPIATWADDGTLFLADWDGTRASIIALGTDGRASAGWPYTVRDGWQVEWLDLDRDGGVTASLTADPCGDGSGDVTLRLNARGGLVGDPPPPPPTPLWKVYEALGLDPLRTSAGSATFRQGDRIDLETALVNRSEVPVILPYTEYADDSWYAAGAMQTWIERLGPEPEMDCLPGAGRKGTWYATGGWIQVSAAPMTITPGGSMSPLFESTLWPDLTGCLPPGAYRYHVEYKPLDGELEDVNDEVSIDLAVAAAEASPPAATPGEPLPTPAPTPRPTPAPPTPAPTPWVNQSPEPSPADAQSVEP